MCGVGKPAQPAARDGEGDRAVFLYGTLLDREVLCRLLGRELREDELEPARLAGFRRMMARAGCWPVLVPDPEGVVEGLLFARPSPEDLRRIAHYEDDYRPERMEVVTAAGRRVSACVWLASLERLPPSEQPWDLALWATQHKRELLQQIDRWLGELEAEPRPAAETVEGVLPARRDEARVPPAREISRAPRRA